MTNIQMFQYFMMDKYYVFQTSFMNTFYALRHLMLGKEPPMMDEVQEETSTGKDDQGSNNEGDARNQQPGPQEDGNNKEQQQTPQRAEL